MPPLPPPAPSRSRSRSRDRFQARVAGVIAAHRRNLRCRRAGQKGQAARRTRAIHKHLLGILIEYLGQLLTGFTRRPPPSEVLVRRRQAEVRLSYLENGNFPANKFEVLPGLREFVQHNPDWREQLGLVSEDLSDIESRSTNDTISVHSSEPEQEAENVNPFGDPVLRAAWERLQAKGPEYIEQLRREVQGQSIPDLPERFRRGPRLEASSSTAAASSSTVPAPKARPSSEEGVVLVRHSTVRITRSNPLLRASQPSPQPVPIRVQYRDPSPREIRWLQLQVIDGQSSLTNSQAVISWDHHLVLDTFRVSSRNVVKASAGEYPRAVKDVLAIVHGLPSNIAQIVCSYCHRDDTVQNVIQCASNQTEFAKIFITRKPTGEQGKLAVLRTHFSLSTVLIHVDDSPEVLGEIQGFINEQGNTCNWRVVGISIRNKRQIPGVHYCINVREALQYIRQKTGLA